MPKPLRQRSDLVPAVGQTYELVKTPEPALIGRHVTVQSVVDDDWYTERFGDARCYVGVGVYLLPDTLASRYRPVVGGSA